jgi:circadian clock protein KaiB
MRPPVPAGPRTRPDLAIRDAPGKLSRLLSTPLPHPRREPALSIYNLRLYVAGKTPRAEQAIANLRRICEQELAGRYDLEIIDVLESPELAEEAKILATPTLIKQLPPPLRRVIGDLSDKEKVLLGLEVRPVLDPPNSTAQ